jgi:uncharacterized damage-inducible protein DinB
MWVEYRHVNKAGHTRALRALDSQTAARFARRCRCRRRYAEGRMSVQLKDHVFFMAEYNHWMNTKIYEACESLKPDQLSENKGAFFGSILGTLNHLVVGDTVWLKRFSASLSSYRELDPLTEIPHPEALNSILFTNLAELKARRDLLDQIFLSFSKAVKDEDLLQAITYKSFKGAPSTKIFFSVLMHVFNHQTHHRGQVTTLLSQLGADIGVTDLVAIFPNA